MKADAGKATEAIVQFWLKMRSDADASFAFHRFPDSRAARGVIPAQPSDLLVVSKKVATFLEAKETAELRRLPRAKVSQWGSLRKWDWAGADVVVIVYRSEFDDWLIFRNKDLFPDGDTPASFAFAGKHTYPTAADALQELFP